MDTQQQQVLWSIAREHYDAAALCAQRGWHNVSIACSYYAVYTAMWVALGDPPRGYWSHRGIIQHFAPGRWRRPPRPLQRPLTKAIRQLYNARIRAQYQGQRATSQESTAALNTASRVMQLVSQTYGLLSGGTGP